MRVVQVVVLAKTMPKTEDEQGTEGNRQGGSRLSVWWDGLDGKAKRRYVTSGVVFGGALIWLVLAVTILKDTFTALKFEHGNGDARDEMYEQRLARRESGAEVNETAIIGAIIGFVLGPIMLVWGYQIVPLVIVCNAFISSGVSNFIVSLAHMDEFNKDISDGRLIPSQAMQLFKITLSAFTLSTVALKVEFFSAAMKAGVVSFVAIEAITNQIPPQYGCMCVDGTVGCSPLYKEELYRTENLCFQDWWLRFGLMAVTVLCSVVVGVRNPVATNKINIAIVGANLCCQVHRRRRCFCCC